MTLRLHIERLVVIDGAPADQARLERELTEGLQQWWAAGGGSQLMGRLKPDGTDRTVSVAAPDAAAAVAGIAGPGNLGQQLGSAISMACSPASPAAPNAPK